jgi:hypothetical protein
MSKKITQSRGNYYIKVLEESPKCRTAAVSLRVKGYYSDYGGYTVISITDDEATQLVEAIQEAQESRRKAVEELNKPKLQVGDLVVVEGYSTGSNYSPWEGYLGKVVAIYSDPKQIAIEMQTGPVSRAAYKEGTFKPEHLRYIGKAE